MRRRTTVSGYVIVCAIAPAAPPAKSLCAPVSGGNGSFGPLPFRLRDDSCSFICGRAWMRVDEAKKASATHAD
eukprot:scaffold222287_cov40-Tisochrysis_lutea.AAC.4